MFVIGSKLLMLTCVMISMKVKDLQERSVLYLVFADIVIPSISLEICLYKVVFGVLYHILLEPIGRIYLFWCFGSLVAFLVLQYLSFRFEGNHNEIVAVPTKSKDLNSSELKGGSDVSHSIVNIDRPEFCKLCRLDRPLNLT